MPQAIYVVFFKYIIFLFCFCCYQTVVGQEEKPHFWLLKVNNSFQSQDTNYISPLHKLKPFLATPDIEEKKHLIKSLYLSQIDTSDYHFAVFSLLENTNQYQRTLIAEDICKSLKIKDENTKEYFYKIVMDTIPKYSIWEENYFTVLDFNHDSHTDMILIPRVYFGPTLGFAFYAYQNNKFEFIFDNSGDVVQIAEKNNQHIIHFALSIIDPQEPLVIQNISYNRKKETAQINTKISYATQTLIPDKLLSPYLSIETTSELTNLRTKPENNDKPIAKSSEINYENRETTTLKGNIVAEFNKKTQGFVLAETDNWAFVALKANQTLKTSSLNHGLDGREYNELTNEIIYNPKPKPYLCGWVSRNDFKILK